VLSSAGVGFGLTLFPARGQPVVHIEGSDRMEVCEHRSEMLLRIDGQPATSDEESLRNW